MSRGYKTSPSGVKVTHKQLVASATAFEEADRPWAIYCHTDGTITMTDEYGVSLAYPMTAGQILPFSPMAVTAIATGVFYGWK